MPCWLTSRSRALIRASVSAWMSEAGTGMSVMSSSSSSTRLRISRSACTPLYSSMRARISPSSSSRVSNSEGVLGKSSLRSGGRGARALDLDGVVVGQLHVGAHLDGRGEGEAVALEVGHLQVGGGDRAQGLAAGGVGVQPRQGVLEHLLADGLPPHAGLEDLAGDLALAEAGDLQLLAQPPDGVRSEPLDLGRVDLHEEADLGRALTLDDRFHHWAC